MRGIVLVSPEKFHFDNGRLATKGFVDAEAPVACSSRCESLWSGPPVGSNLCPGNERAPLGLFRKKRRFTGLIRDLELTCARTPAHQNTKLERSKYGETTWLTV